MTDSSILAILLDPDFGFGSRIVEGIQQEAQKHHRWTVLPLASSQEPLLRSLMESGKIGGIIGAFLSDRWAQDFANIRSIPVVNVGDASEIRSIPSVLVDNLAVGRLAAHHLLETGITNFGLLCDRASHASLLRKEGFLEALQAASIESVSEPPRAQGYAIDDEWGEWVLAQPHPIAVFCTDDFLARRLIRRVLQVGLQVPNDVAVLGVGDAPLDTVLSLVPLSSIRLPSARIGVAALRLVEALLRASKESLSGVSKTLPPEGISTRDSSSFRPATGPVVRKAVTYLSTHLSESPSVSDLARICNVSRRTLEQAFQRDLHHSPGDEIRSLRMTRAKQLLSNSGLPLATIAETCGFQNLPWFWTSFKKAQGVTPQEFRNASAKESTHPL